MQNHPPELKGFHTRNMMHALLVMLVPIAAWVWAFYRQEAFAAKDELQSALHWIFMIGVGAFMMTILIKALITVPKCPECQRKMRQLETINITEKTVLNFKSFSRWRIVECPHCNLRYRIPGLSNE
jgi:hypothetical protein